MRIGEHIIRRSSVIRKKLIKWPEEMGSHTYWAVLQIYQCRIFGLCHYRTTDSDRKLHEKFLKLTNKKDC